jgi:hypothetical protein
MHEWNEHREPAGKSERVDFTLRFAPGTSPVDAIAALVAKACDAMPAVQPSTTFDSILISFRPDSGRVLAFPARGGRFILERRVVVWVQMPDLESRYYALPDVEADAQAFEAAHDLLSDDLRRSLAAACRLPDVASSIDRARAARPDLGFYTVEYDDAETVTALTV